jgi:transcription initiation factor TFIIIB Brf1 subunit/transcription initiation factor TFIIB
MYERDTEKQQAIKMIIYDPVRGEYIDEETGEVIEDRIADPMGGERHVLERYGRFMRYSVHDRGITTFINKPKREEGDLRILPKDHARIIFAQASARRSDGERRLVRLLKMLHMFKGRLSNRYYIPNEVVEDAALIIRKIMNRMPRSVRERVFVISSLYLASKRFGIHINPKDLIEVAYLEKKRKIKMRRFFRATQDIIEILGVDGEKRETDHIKRKIENIREYIERIFEERHDPCVYSNSMTLLETLENMMRKNHDVLKDLAIDKAVAAALVRLSLCRCGGIIIKGTCYSEIFTQRKLGKILDISDITIRKYEKILRKILENT